MTDQSETKTQHDEAQVMVRSPAQDHNLSCCSWTTCEHWWEVKEKVYKPAKERKQKKFEIPIQPWTAEVLPAFRRTDVCPIAWRVQSIYCDNKPSGCLMKYSWLALLSACLDRWFWMDSTWWWSHWSTAWLLWGRVWVLASAVLMFKTSWLWSATSSAAWQRRENQKRRFSPRGGSLSVVVLMTQLHHRRLRIILHF